MKKVLFLCMVLVLIFSIVGCKKDDSKNNEVEITFTASEADQAAVYEKIFNGFIDEYNSENETDIKLKIVSGQGKDITNTRMSSNDKPDIFMLDSPADVAQYVRDDLLYDLTSAAEKNKWSEKLFDWAYDLSVTDGKVYTLPYGYEGMVIWYNKNIMKELELNAEDIDTLSEFENALKLASEKGYTPIMLGSQDWPWAQEWYLSILFSYTGKELVKNTIEGKDNASWENEEFKKTVELYKSWHDRGYLADKRSYVLTSDDAINAFTTDKALFKVEGTWATYWVGPLEGEDREKVGVMLHPAINDTEKPHMPLAVGGMWCVSKDTEHPEVVEYIINQLLREDIQSDFIGAGLDVAPMSIDDSEFEDLEGVVKEMWQMVNGALEQGNYGYATWAFYPPETRVYLYEGIVNVLEGNITIDDYLAEMQKLTEKERQEGFVPILP
ncbi:sugar ABC transporter substrate-binding protein [Vallitalea longa]|uniref:Sugar ABC transporter substrate-binding protein n=1 Tax=Vallitalea longa TaxID=2936439 RepID=A0A9W5Y981_9FIRM|nr:ABC transporter substrate-binding protein [Vallitalea longa]GKX28416.1 sugar ABC transporter substrate-binding protein [Vallitalea longa]